ncbi:RNA polymerase sigma-70 factor (sigma-E family) [Nocardioides ginsengisegetis]|uniref:RNA polymerase sigma-70 factor (Sigma-E family) n=1 Tax=Nocardioides ginsengisegetis TaxID=661491 RepID=A0A7W3P9J9_9ACTN|nr:SigE family RNA polymerase sigma factor [Nocardioides ginsengisegetis]MBA8803623.1 RNA polymerase sigma-70 factor (sigma-E family) [Nocardioides ginsengisegetis]
MRNDGEVTEFSEFAHACAPSLLRTAYLVAGDHQLAQDLLQEALVKTLLAWPRLHDRDNLEAYTRRIIVTTSISWRRRRSFHERPTEALPERPGTDPTQALVDHEAVIAALRALAPRQRAAIVLRYYQDLTEAQTAEAMGCSIGAVKSQVSVGLTRLRASLGPTFEAAGTTESEATA